MPIRKALIIKTIRLLAQIRSSKNARLMHIRPPRRRRLVSCREKILLKSESNNTTPKGIIWIKLRKLEDKLMSICRVLYWIQWKTNGSVCAEWQAWTRFQTPIPAERKSNAEKKRENLSLGRKKVAPPRTNNNKNRCTSILFVLHNLTATNITKNKGF